MVTSIRLAVGVNCATRDNNCMSRLFLIWITGDTTAANVSKRTSGMSMP